MEIPMLTPKLALFGPCFWDSKQLQAIWLPWLGWTCWTNNKSWLARTFDDLWWFLNSLASHRKDCDFFPGGAVHSVPVHVRYSFGGSSLVKFHTFFHGFRRLLSYSASLKWWLCCRLRKWWVWTMCHTTFGRWNILHPGFCRLLSYSTSPKWWYCNSMWRWSIWFWTMRYPT